MSKRLKNLKWESVAYEGFPASIAENLNGFVGLEECTNYGLDRDSKRPKKKKQPEKRKASPSVVEKVEKEVPNKKVRLEKEVPSKKVRLSNGFIEETIINVAPSVTNEENNVLSRKQRRKKKLKEKKAAKAKKKAEKAKENEVKEVSKKKEVGKAKESEIKVVGKKKKPKLGERTGEIETALTPEDMLTWAEFKLPESILKALAELGFKKPTKIQELVLPAAVHGRRDILGAAETGSGKTLAFGIPILNGILKLKEKAAAGFDVYEIPYKKTSNKKKQVTEKGLMKKKNSVKKTKEKKAKESSEEGYSSGENSEENVADENSNEEGNSDDESGDENSTDEEVSGDEDESDDEGNPDENSEDDDEESEDDGSGDDDDDDEKSEEEKSDSFIEEYDVPIKKSNKTVDEGSDDSDENYLHLSDLLDDDDDADSSDNDEETPKNDSVDDKVSDEEEESDAEIEDEGEEIVDDGGIGCVKVIDNVAIPGHAITKTGKPLYSLILTPTRELAIQISRHLMAVAKYTGIRIATIVGGMADVKQERMLRGGPEVVVATPGRLWELLQRGHPHLQQMHTVKFLAIDETDRMVERGHFEELTPLLEQLNADDTHRSSRQNFVFSATLTMVHDLPSHLKGKKVTKRGKIINRRIEKMTPQQKIKNLVKMIGMTEPKVVDITSQNLGTAETLTESRIACSLEDKDAYLFYVLKRHPGRTIVFCNSIGCVRRLAQILTILKCNPLPLHANMAQRQRLKNLERFRDDPHGVLVSTDVAARGLDIPDVDHVLHFQVPRTAENYVHRSGRTARATKEGLTILMMEPAEAYLYTKLCKTLNKTSDVPPFPVCSQSLSSLKQLVGLAREVDALELRRRRAAQAAGWRDKVARELDIIVDDEFVPQKHADPAVERALKAKRRQLTAMMSRPLFPRGFAFKYPTLNQHTPFSTNQDALQVMKKSLETGDLKKERRKGKNASLLNLQKKLKQK